MTIADVEDFLANDVAKNWNTFLSNLLFMYGNLRELGPTLQGL
jgi:hypothetical protein